MTRLGFLKLSYGGKEGGGEGWCEVVVKSLTTPMGEKTLADISVYKGEIPELCAGQPNLTYHSGLYFYSSGFHI